jgi:hypothetical protein
MDLHAMYESAREPDRYDAIQSNVIPFPKRSPFGSYMRRKPERKMPVMPVDWGNGPEVA